MTFSARKRRMSFSHHQQHASRASMAYIPIALPSLNKPHLLAIGSQIRRKHVSLSFRPKSQAKYFAQTFSQWFLAVHPLLRNNTLSVQHTDTFSISSKMLTAIWEFSSSIIALSEGQETLLIFRAFVGQNELFARGLVGETPPCKVVTSVFFFRNNGNSNKFRLTVGRCRLLASPCGTQSVVLAANSCWV